MVKEINITIAVVVAYTTIGPPPESDSAVEVLSETINNTKGTDFRRAFRSAPISYITSFSVERVLRALTPRSSLSHMM